MKIKLLQALWWVIKNAPAIVETIKAARDRHPESSKEAVKP